MANLETTYLGIKIKNPLVAASSGLTSSLDKIKELEQAGVGAVVLKSIFEEQINGEIGDLIKHSGHHGDYPEADYYIENYVRNNSVTRHTSLVTKIKHETNLPVIASVNGVSSSGWTSFARDLEDAGADAIELNVFYLPVNRQQTSAEVEKLYTDILQAVVSSTRIPVAVKIGSHFTNIIGMAEKLKANGAKGLVIFNRFYEPDINLEKLEPGVSDVFSSPAELRHALRWVSLVSSQVSNIDLAASTGIHDGNAVIKQLLAGAQITQICSAIYLHGAGVITQMAEELRRFMDQWNFETVDDFRGRLSAKKVADPMLYERSQFMKYYSNRQ